MLNATILGASGLVGSEVLKRLLDEPRYAQVSAIVRRPLSLSHAKLKIETLELTELAKSLALKDSEHIYCCLGTTIKKAGSQEAFEAVDFDGPVNAARAALDNSHVVKLKKFLVVSALGADSRSNVFYNRVKGNMEQALCSLSIPELHVFRPSLLLGDRAEKRVAEKLAMQFTKPLMWIFRGPLKKYKPVDARSVAHAMLYAALAPDENGQFFHESETLE